MRCVPVVASILFALLASIPAHAEGQEGDGGAVDRFVENYCLSCHDAQGKSGGISLEGEPYKDPGGRVETWERVARMLDAGRMPPQAAKQPTPTERREILSRLIGDLDRIAEAHPDPGRTEPFRRLTRTEYGNAVRDLLALPIDAKTLLPADESSRGFDNITVADLSPTLLDGYLTAARKISRSALGITGRTPDGETFRVPANRTQEEHVDGLPPGTRGGLVIPYHFPRDGEYEIQVRLTRDRNEHVEGLREPHRLELLIDKDRVALLTVNPPRSEKEHETCDAGLKARIKISAGTRNVGATFLKKPSSLPDTKRQPYQARYNMHRHPRLNPAVYQVTITGPHGPSTPANTASRRAVIPVEPARPEEEDARARESVASLVRRAYRRPATEADIAGPFRLYVEGKREGGFDAGMESALSAILVNPRFLFKIEPDPIGAARGSVHKLMPTELASRLSFFLWGSLPDEPLLTDAERGTLAGSEVLRGHVRRMLNDPRSSNLVTNFADQWLQLRNLDSVTPDLRLFPDYDDNLGRAFRFETELMIADIIRNDGSILEMIRRRKTNLNERLARHYDIPHVRGDRFREVELPEGSERGGLLRQGGILTVTSYATRTSPVIRGKWILETLLGTPPPPPPANVPALKDQTVDASLSVRERLAEHRRDANCSGCHRLMDPVGFTLENYDAVGRYREAEDGLPIDASGGLPDGRSFSGVAGLEQALLDRPDLFATALTEKLLTFALGRVVEPSDGAAVRKIVRRAKDRDYRFSAIVEGITESIPFQMRKAR